MNALAKKLQMKPGQHWLILNAPENVLPIFEPVPDNVRISFGLTLPAEGIILFIKSRQEQTEQLFKLKPDLKSDTILWLIYPKKSSGIATDLTMDNQRLAPAAFGLHPVTAVAVNDQWTALRFKPDTEVKLTETCNSQLPDTPYAEYIDVANRQVTLPQDASALLEKNPSALDAFMQLSYTNQKEYALWILTAKQEKTRADRLYKMIEKLQAGKKNPSEK